MGLCVAAGRWSSAGCIPRANGRPGWFVHHPCSLGQLCITALNLHVMNAPQQVLRIRENIMWKLTSALVQYFLPLFIIFTHTVGYLLTSLCTLNLNAKGLQQSSEPNRVLVYRGLCVVCRGLSGSLIHYSLVCTPLRPHRNAVDQSRELAGELLSCVRPALSCFLCVHPFLLQLYQLALRTHWRAQLRLHYRLLELRRQPYRPSSSTHTN